MKRDWQNIGHKRAEQISDAASRAGVSVYDEEANGGRLVVIDRTVIYTCTDARAIGSLLRCDDEAAAIAVAQEMIDLFANVE